MLTLISVFTTSRNQFLRHCSLFSFYCHFFPDIFTAQGLSLQPSLHILPRYYNKNNEKTYMNVCMVNFMSSSLYYRVFGYLIKQYFQICPIGHFCMRLASKLVNSVKLHLSNWMIQSNTHICTKPHTHKFCFSRDCD